MSLRSPWTKSRLVLIYNIELNWDFQMKCAYHLALFWDPIPCSKYNTQVIQARKFKIFLGESGISFFSFNHLKKKWGIGENLRKNWGFQDFFLIFCRKFFWKDLVFSDNNGGRRLILPLVPFIIGEYEIQLTKKNSIRTTDFKH